MRITLENSVVSSNMSVIDFLIKREEGAVRGFQAVREYHRLKTAAKTLVENNYLDINQPSCAIDVSYIKGGSKSILGLWEASNGKYILGEVPFINQTGENTIGFSVSEAYIEDMCEGICDSVAFVHNSGKETIPYPIYNSDDEDLEIYNPTSNGSSDLLGILELMWRARSSNETDCYQHFHSKKTQLYCCSDVTAYGNIYLAIGGHKRIICYNGISPERVFKVKEKVYTVAYNETATVIVSGHSDGNLYINDIRSADKSIKIELKGDKHVMDSYFMSPQEVIVSGSSNKLCTIDIRSMKPVAEFLGHKHSERKQPLSVANGMLCANGADNVLRLWPLAGGFPIHEIQPSVKGNTIRGWLASDCNTSFLYCFEGINVKVFQV